jgi:hypothetical protein
MNVTVAITGRTQLVLHNPRLADPLDRFTRAIKEIHAKGTRQTDADHAEVGKLEWEGSLYLNPDQQLALPSFNLVSCFYQGATATKNGSALFRALVPEREWYEIETGEPRVKMTELNTWRTTIVNSGRAGGRTVRTRPRFREWALTFTGFLADDELSLRDLKTAIDRAGRLIGIGDAKKLGYGRFEAKVSQS